VRSADATLLEPQGLVAVADAGVSALASPYDGAPAADAEQLRAHQRITTRIHDAAPSLPSRFGQFFRDEETLSAALRERSAGLLDELKVVGERAELSVTLSWREAPERPTVAQYASGREFLQAKAAREREYTHAEAVVARLVDHLAVDQAAVRWSICPREGVAAIVAILIARDGAQALRESIGSFEQRSSEVTARVYGPLPPYSFAS
jgi:hypothetical protein